VIRKFSQNEITIALLAVGGHTVLEKLLSHQIRIAIYQSLGVAACVLIFLVLHRIVGAGERNSE